MSIVKIMSAGAVKKMVAMLGAEYEKATGAQFEYQFGTVGVLRDRLEKGEAADLVVLSQSAIAKLAARDLVVADSITDLADTVTGVAVREGAAAPDISTPEAFKQTLLDASTVAYVDPKAGGSSGMMFAQLLDKLGIADAVNRKAVLGQNGHSVAVSIAEGRAELGSTFVSEILPVPGARVIGLLPGDLHNANTYTAALHAGSAKGEAVRGFLTALTDPANDARWTAAGLEPTF